LLALGLAVSACTISDEGYARIQKAVRNPDIGRAAHSECTEMIGRQPRKTRERVAGIMGVSPAMVPSVYCRRVFNGVASGRLTRADWDSMSKGKPSENLLKVIKGRG